MDSQTPTFVLDNGGGSIKAGVVSGAAGAGADAESGIDCRVMLNAIGKARTEKRRPFIGAQIQDCRDTSGLFFLLPFQKGYLAHPDTQKIIWDYLFGNEGFGINPGESNILITEPMLNLVPCQEIGLELLYEEYEFAGVARSTAPSLADYKYANDHSGENVLCSLVVDSGYSFTHVVPIVNGQQVREGIKRIDIGGKALTNHLKEILSYRQLHVLDETYLINQVKEELCFVSQDLYGDMAVSRNRSLAENTILREYVLPDYTTVPKGFIRPLPQIGTKAGNNEQILRMNNERFSVPELLFHPSDVGLGQMGISETIVTVIEGFPEQLQPHFYQNIILTGGNANFPGFQQRVESDVRKEAPGIYDVKTFCDPNPTTYAWKGGLKFVLDPDFKEYVVDRKTYLENGLSAFKTKADIA